MLDVHNGKLNICEIHNGTEFLGTSIKPYRTYTSRKTIKRIKNNLNNLDFSKPYKIIMSINSYLGIKFVYMNLLKTWENFSNWR